MRREVRVSNAFFGDVDHAFPSERGPNGEPSRDDFVRLALFGLVEQVAERFDSLPQEPAADGIRILVTSGFVVPVVAMYATEGIDRIVYLIGLEVDRTGDWE